MPELVPVDASIRVHGQIRHIEAFFAETSEGGFVKGVVVGCDVDARWEAENRQMIEVGWLLGDVIGEEVVMDALLTC